MAAIWKLIHGGSVLDTPAGADGICSISEIATLDDSKACPTCSRGVEQVGRLRIPASALNKQRRIAWVNVGCSFSEYLIEEGCVSVLPSWLWNDVELREVEQVGRTKPRTRWHQVIPTTIVRTAGFTSVRRVMKQCSSCGTPWPTERPGMEPIWPLPPERLPQGERFPRGIVSLDAAWPFDENGPRLLHSKKDGRIIRFAGMATYFGDDAKHAIEALKDRRLTWSVWAVEHDDPLDPVERELLARGSETRPISRDEP